MLFALSALFDLGSNFCASHISPMTEMRFLNRSSTSTRVLASILNDIGASERLQVFIEDGLDDGNLKNLRAYGAAAARVRC